MERKAGNSRIKTREAIQASCLNPCKNVRTPPRSRPGNLIKNLFLTISLILLFVSLSFLTERSPTPERSPPPRTFPCWRRCWSPLYQPLPGESFQSKDIPERRRINSKVLVYNSRKVSFRHFGAPASINRRRTRICVTASIC